MEKGWTMFWRRLGRMERAFLFSVVLYIVLRLSAISPILQTCTAILSILLGVITLFRLARRGMKEAIWRLRNRLIVAYLFFAVVPVVLILTLVGIAGWLVIGQMAVYLVNTELSHRETSLWRPVEAL